MALWLARKCGRHTFSFSLSLSLHEIGCGNTLHFANPRQRNAFQWARCIRVKCSRFLGHWTTTLKFLEVEEREEVFQSIFYIPTCGVTLIRMNNNFMVEPLRKWQLRIRKYLRSNCLRCANVDLVGVSKDFVRPHMFRRIMSVLRGTVYASLEHGQDWTKLVVINVTTVPWCVMHCVVQCSGFIAPNNSVRIRPNYTTKLRGFY